MPDPAEDAAKRAWTGFAGGVFNRDDPEYRVLLDVARAVLDPIQKLHRPVRYLNRQRCCVTCFDGRGGPMVWPCPTAEAVFPTEELER